MTDRPISFVAPMIRALWDDRKTQTRRVTKPQPRSAPIRHDGIWTDCDGFKDGPYGALRNDVSPLKLQYSIGDRLWVREDFRFVDSLDPWKPSEVSGAWVHYNATDTDASMGDLPEGSGDEYGRRRWSNHMPRWASRMTLTVTDVRVQRVRDITNADAMAEGIEKHPCCGFMNYLDQTDPHGWIAPQNSFRTLWDSINAERGHGWDVNPWVAAYTFTVEKRNIDQMTADGA